ncbi:MAG: hypothetical protein ABH805_01480 [Candidatus Nealsonbacteria bacterium]
MNEEKWIEFSRKICELAEKEGLSLDELIQKKELGEVVLKLWEEGEEKPPEEVLRADFARLIREIQHLREGSK